MGIARRTQTGAVVLAAALAACGPTSAPSDGASRVPLGRPTFPRTIDEYEALAPAKETSPGAAAVAERLRDAWNDSSLARSLGKWTHLDDPLGRVRRTDDYPYVGAIVRIDPVSGERRIVCTATALSPSAILTAAHCVHSSTDRLRIDQRPDEFYFVPSGNARTGSLDHRIVAPVLPATYEGNEALDLGVAHLETPLAAMTFPQLGRRAQPSGQYVKKVGYGLWTDHSDPTQPIRRIGYKTAATMKVTSFTDAAARFEYAPHDPPRGQICNGDSGGPALVRGNDGLEYIVGVTHGSKDPRLACHDGGTDTVVPGPGAEWIARAL